MSSAAPSHSYFIGWDVGGWNCDHNPNSRDALVILNSEPNIVGKAWRGNLRATINDSANTKEYVKKLFSICDAEMPPGRIRVTLAIDTPLGFSTEFIKLATESKIFEPLSSSATNPYLYRQTERWLFEHGKHPLSSVKDMIGSQATKGMHVLAKFAPQIVSCGVWSDGELLTAIEAYPSAGKDSHIIAKFWVDDEILSFRSTDERDAYHCALVAYLFTMRPEDLFSPAAVVPTREGWIWVPKDIYGGNKGHAN